MAKPHSLEIYYSSTRSTGQIMENLLKDWISFWVKLLDHKRNGQTGKSMKLATLKVLVLSE